MPVYFSQLNEAWITAVNIDKTGSSGSYTYTRQSGECGQTAQYCLGADGKILQFLIICRLWTAIENIRNILCCTSNSRCCCLLSEHFPNHSAEQLVDRLLASADNSFFTRDGDSYIWKWCSAWL